MDIPRPASARDDATQPGGELFALRLHHERQDPNAWFGELEHVLSGRRHAFRGGVQLIDRLTRELVSVRTLPTSSAPIAALSTRLPGVTMNPSSVSLVQSSFSQVQALGPQAGDLFYKTLFTHHPALRPLFKGDIAAQSETLMRMIGVAVSQLHDLPALLPVLQRLGARHVGYGVLPAHYDAVGAALLQTLATGLGPAWTPAVRDAWTEVYTLIASVMVHAGASCGEPSTPTEAAV